MQTYKKMGGIVLAAALVLSGIPTDTPVQAAKSTATLSAKKVTLTIGSTKKISIRSKAKIKKLKFSLSKKQKKILSVKKKSSKSILIKAKKDGKVTLKLHFYAGKKKMTKTVSISVKKAAPVEPTTPTTAPLAAPSASPAGSLSQNTPAATSEATPAATPKATPATTPATTPTVTPEANAQSLDLSKFDIQKEEEGAPVYDETTKTLTAKDVAQFILTLPQDVNTGETVKVTINGINNGTAGFRCWLSDSSFANLSEIHKSAENGVSSGDFSMTVEMSSTGAADKLLIKGASYGTNMDDIVFTSITITYSGTSEAKEPKQPYQPENEQAWDTSSLTLTDSFRDKNGTEVKSLLVSQRFIADPTTIEYNGRLYVYGTTDEIEFDGKANVVSNAYNTHTISCISTEDMVNWKDEGVIDVTKLTNYAKKSWAPSIVSQTIQGKEKFFLYYTTGGDGIAVLEADSPTGPWSDPIGDRLIDRSTPTCTSEEVPWLFDPGVFVDDDGSAYIYFGGNGGGSEKDSGSGRICKLGSDMISLAETPHKFSPYYYFEDNEINKFGDTYYYSYSTNWSSDLANEKDSYTGQACIAYYSADNPYMENATFHGTVFANPGGLYDHFYNNHHHMFTFKGKNYISYHTTYLERMLYGTKQGYRSLHIDPLTIHADGTLSADASYEGVGAVGTIDASKPIDANIMSDNGGLTTSYSESQKQMVLTQINTGDWAKLSGVTFANTASKINVSLCSDTDKGSIELYIDGKPGEANAKKAGEISLVNTGGKDTYQTVSAALSEPLSGQHDLYFVFRGTSYQVASWTFSN